MSLQIWLPLTKDAENYGVNSAKTSSTATFENGGKTGGKCMTDGTITIPAANAGQFLNNNSFSYACWIYVQPGAENSGGTFFGTESMEANNNRKFSLFQYPNPVDLHWSWQNDTANATYTAGSLLNFFTTGEWTHLAVTYQNPNIKIYRNGQLYHSATGVSNSSSFAYLLNVAKVKSTHRKMNDVRIYDHCLSQKEVQELAKGLVLHYRLAGPGQENIIEHSHNGSGWSIGNGWTSFTDGDGTKGYRFTRTGATSNNWVRVIPPTKINPNDYPEGITVSMDIKTPDISAVNHTCVGALQIYDSTGVRSGWCEPHWDLSKVKNNVWTRVSYFFTQAQLRTISQSGMTYSYTMFSFQLVQNGDISIKNFKAERGNVRTPWTPNKADAAWTTMGYSNNIEYDCSGYGNNGTKSGQLTWNVDSPRYTTSYKVGLTKAYVDTPNIAFEQMLQGTLNMWINRHSSTSDWRQYACFANGYNWTSTEQDFIIIGSTGGATLCLDCCSNTYLYTPTLNEWHMYTIAWDLQQHTSNFYIDGELVRTTTNSRIDTLYASKHNYHAFGNRLSSDVNDYSMSDARIYSTVLSAEAVAELYHSAVIIDNTGKTYAYEYFEG